MGRVLGSREVENAVDPALGFVARSEATLPGSALAQLGSSASDIEDIFACSPSQQGMLLTQSKDPEMYWFRLVYEVLPPSTSRITSETLCEAWNIVVERHQSSSRPLRRAKLSRRAVRPDNYSQVAAKRDLR